MNRRTTSRDHPALSHATSTMSLTTRFATGGLGGILGWCIIHPANTLAIQMTLQAATMGSSSKAQQSFVAFSRNLIAQRGFMSLYDGISAGCARQIFYATSRLGLFEVFRDAMAGLSASPTPVEPKRPNHVAKSSSTVTFQTRVIAGLASGGLAALISCPAEVCLVRMSNDKTLPIEQRRNYRSVIDAGMRIGREEGLSAFWRGSGAFVQRAMVVGVCQVGSFDQLKSIYAERLDLARGTVGNVFCAAMTSGLLYSAITMPLETAKNRMAFQKPNPTTGVLPYRGTLQTIQAVASMESVLALWTGFFPYYIRCGGHTVAMFVAVDYIRSALNAST